MSRPLFQLLYCQFLKLPALLDSGHAPSGWPPILGKSTLHFLSSRMWAAGEEPNRVDLPSYIHDCWPWMLDHLSDVFGQLVLWLSVVADPSLLQSPPTPSFPTSSQSQSRPPAFVLHREQTQLGRNLSTILLSKPWQSWSYQTSLTTSVPSGLPSLLFYWVAISFPDGNQSFKHASDLILFLFLRKIILWVIFYFSWTANLFSSSLITFTYKHFFLTFSSVKKWSHL